VITRRGTQALCVTLAVFAATWASASASGSTGGSDAELASTAVVVGLPDPSATARLARSLSSRGVTVDRIPHLRALTLRGEDRPTLARLVRGGLRVDYIEPLRERHLHAEPADAIDPATGLPFTWALDAVRAREGLAATDSPGAPVGVVDTGIDLAHPDLAGRIMAGHDVLGTGSVADASGHGTFVAGLISAIDGNGIGGRGVAGATPIIPVRVSAGTSITSADLAAGIVAAVDAGARVINISIGGPGYAEVERAAIEYAVNNDVLLVASAGNSALDGNTVEYPAAAIGGDAGGWSDGLSVAATDPLGRAAPFSSHNRHVSMAAPGAGASGCSDGVYSTIPSGPAALWPGTGCGPVFSGTHGPGRYAYSEGTSFSAPLVAGAGALVRGVTPALRADQVADVLRRSATRAAPGEWNEYTGAGILNVADAVALSRRYDIAPPDLALITEEGVGSLRVKASGSDRTSPGRELAGDVALNVDYSRDGNSYWALLPPTGQPIDRSYGASEQQPLWIRVTACDANRNCTVRAEGPFRGTTANAPTGAPPTPPLRAGPLRPRASILALGIPRSCAVRPRACVRIAWKGRTHPLRPLRVRYAVDIREQTTGVVLARAAGATRIGRRTVLNLTLRQRPMCGRIVARLTLRIGGQTSRATRRASVTRGCVNARVRMPGDRHQRGSTLVSRR
jgi:subtilisin family serine protease